MASVFISGAYLEPAYPDALYQLASRIVNEGMDHFERFREIGLVVRQYPKDSPPYLRAITLASPGDPAVKDALDLYRTIVAELTTAYSTGRVDERAAIIRARHAMTKLNALADDLGSRGVGIPFFPQSPAT